MSKEEKEKTVEETSIHLGEVATGTASVIIYNGKVISDQEALVEILNQLKQINNKL